MRIDKAMLFAGLIAFGATAVPVIGCSQQMPPPMPQSEQKMSRPQVCPEIYEPVCAKKLGHPKGYSNECFARMDGAADIKAGVCNPGE